MLLGILVLILIIMLSIIQLTRAVRLQNTPLNIAIKILLAIIIVVSTSLAVFTSNYMIRATDKGIYPTLNTLAGDYIKQVESYPDDDSYDAYIALQRSTMRDGDIVVFYRPDCSDCIANLPKYLRLNDSDSVYFVCTKTEYGDKLKIEYGVHWVPSVYEYKDGKLTNSDNVKSLEKLDNLIRS